MEPLLKYQIRTSPTKLLVGERGIAALEVTVPDPKINCKSIQIDIPAGITEYALFRQANGIKSELIQVSKAWKIMISREPEEEYKTIIIENLLYETDEEPYTLPVSIQMTGDVSNQKGTFEIRITEKSGMAGETAENRTAVIDGDKEVDFLYCENFYAAAKDSNYLTQVDPGMEFTLKWEGNGKRYTIYYNDTKKETAETFLTVKEGIHMNTGFMLVAEQGNQQISKYLGITVRRPDLFGKPVIIYEGDIPEYNTIFTPDADGILVGAGMFVKESQTTQRITFTVIDQKTTWKAEDAISLPAYANERLIIMHQSTEHEAECAITWRFIPLGQESRQ